MTKGRPIFLDYHSTTPVDSEVVTAMLPFFTEEFGNAASTDHAYGSAGHEAAEHARRQVAKAVGAAGKEIVFTSGATESDNLAVIGVAEAQASKGRHIVTSQIEHPAVLDSCRHLEQRGWDVTYLPVDHAGLHSAMQVEEALRPNTTLVSIMAANNEIGVLQPIGAIGATVREHGALFHTDATQALAYVPIDVHEMNIDLLSLSGHKVYGPKGVGALFVRRTYPRVRLQQQMHGGGHERGLRSGTLNVPGIVGLGHAVKLSSSVMSSEAARLQELRDAIWSTLKDELGDVELNGHVECRLPNNLNFSIPGVESRSLLVQVADDVALATGSACSTAKVEPSHVIQALGFGDDRAHTSVRLSLGRPTTMEEAESATASLIDAVKRIRSVTPRA